MKDNSKIPRDPTEEELHLFCRPKQLLSKGKKSVSSTTSITSNSSNGSKPSATKTSFAKTKYKEKGVVIKVMKSATNFSKMKETNTNDNGVEDGCCPFNTNGNGKNTEIETEKDVNKTEDKDNIGEFSHVYEGLEPII